MRLFLLAITAALLLCPELLQASKPARDFQLVSAARAAEYRALLPSTDDPRLKKLFARHLIWYDEEVMPRTHFQTDPVASPKLALLWGQGHHHSPYLDSVGQPNVEFPWHKTAGLDNTTNTTTVKFMYLPAPIVYFTSTRTRAWLDISQRYMTMTGWDYPDGAEFGENLLLKDPQGKYISFEVRTRRKVSGDWYSDVYKPVRTREDLRHEIVKLDSNATEVLASLDSPKVSIERLRNKHSVTVIDRTAAIENLPALPESTVRKLLHLPFSSSYNTTWITHDNVNGYAPTTDARFSIVPAGYQAGFIRVTHHSCKSCHETTKYGAPEFQFPREWYGGVSGDDFILSANPMEPASISTYGSLRAPEVSRALVAAGLLVPWKED